MPFLIFLINLFSSKSTSSSALASEFDLDSLLPALFADAPGCLNISSSFLAWARASIQGRVWWGWSLAALSITYSKVKRLSYCIQLWIRPVLFSPYGDPRLIRPVLNSPTHNFFYIILYLQFNWPSFKFALRSEGEIFPVYSSLWNIILYRPKLFAFHFFKTRRVTCFWRRQLPTTLSQNSPNEEKISMLFDLAGMWCQSHLSYL